MPAAYDDDDDRDAPQESDLEWAEQQDDDEDTVACPGCGRDVYWDAQRCPACGAWMDEARSTAAQRSRGWVWPAIVAILIAVILVIWLGLRS